MTIFNKRNCVWMQWLYSSSWEWRRTMKNQSLLGGFQTSTRPDPTLKQVLLWGSWRRWLPQVPPNLYFFSMNLNSFYQRRNGRKRSSRIEDLRNRHVCLWPNEKNRFPTIYFSGFVFLWKRKLGIVWKWEIQLNQKSLIFLAPVFQK